MGAVVLVITGAEALYADMGHFGGGAIARAWSVDRTMTMGSAVSV